MILALVERGAVVHRVNTGWFPTRMRVTVDLVGRWRGRLCTPSGEVNLDEVGTVWYRAPEAFGMPTELSRAEAAHARVEAKYGLGGMAIDEDGVRKNVYTRLLDESDFADLRGIEHTSHLFQRWVPKGYECRVIVVGDQMTAAAITAGSQAAYVDYRTDYDSLSYELVDPPAHVVTGVHALMDSSGLVYAALDFVVTPDGEWVFLEINPAGQYGNIEHHTGAPLTDQLADMFAGAS